VDRDATGRGGGTEPDLSWTRAATRLFALLVATASPSPSVHVAAHAPGVAPVRPGIGEAIDERTIPLSRAGDPMLVLRGAAPRTHIAVAVPHGWLTASVALRLGWQASPVFAPSSVLEVDVNGVPRFVVALRPGAGTGIVRSPMDRVVGSTISIDISAVLRTAGDECPPPDAPGAFVRIDPSSPLTVTGIRDRAPPRLADLPGALVDRLGDSVPALAIVTSPFPAAEEIRAAALVAGAVSSATGFPGMRTRLLLGASEADLRAERGNLVRLEPGGSRPRLAVSRRSDGSLEVVVSGAGGNLLTAARALASGGTAGLTGSASGVRAGGGRGLRRPPGRVAFGPAAAIGTGGQSITLPFRVPAWTVAVRPARLALLIGFDAPAGARLAVDINDRPLGAFSLPRQGTGRLPLRYELAAGDLRPGDNAAHLRVDLAGAAAGRCAPLSVPPRVTVLPPSGVTWHSRDRSPVPTLALWPYPLDAEPAWRGAAVVLPSRPSAAELEAVVDVLAEAARWDGEPVSPAVVVGSSAKPQDRHLLVIVRDGEVPEWLRLRGSVARETGTLTVERFRGHLAVVAFGPRALGPLRSGYFVGRLPARTVVVSASGVLRTLEPTTLPPMPSEPRVLPWPLLWGLIVVGLVAVFALLLRLAYRRTRSLPPPEPVGEAPPSAPLTPGPADRGPRGVAPLEEWRRLAEEEEGSDDQ
jgi:hypothetical protein